MLILTAKLPRRRLALGAAAAAFVCCVALTLFLHPPRAVPASAAPDNTGIRSNPDRTAYLQQLGWAVKEEPVTTQELKLPKEFDQSYAEYLALQAGQGFDLNRYAGKRVKRYSYEVLNYPTGEQGVLANLLIYKSTVIGGEVLSPRLDGFLHGLSMP